LILVCGILLNGTVMAAGNEDHGFQDLFWTLNKDRWRISDGWTNGSLQSCEWRADAVHVGSGDVRLTVSDRGGKISPIGCPEISTFMSLGYGLYEARMRSAAGAGLDTGFFTYTGPPFGVPSHDEIDFEFLGKNPHTVQINYFTNGKGQHEYMVPLDFDASQSFHTYAFEWMPDKIRWYVDGKLVHETPAGAEIPSNPGRLFLDIWSGSSDEDAWLGHFDYKAPMTADVQWVAFTPAGAACAFPESLRCKH
jgi:endo-1,3-1,4-beta-glycanase ExoK